MAKLSGPTTMINQNYAAKELTHSPVMSVVTLSAALLLALQIAVSVGFLIAIPIGQWTLPTALLIALPIFVWTQKSRVVMSAVATGMTVVLWFCALLIAGSIYDSSWDGQHYHQELILQLASGWNPVYEEWRAEDRGIIDMEIGLWLNYYAKAGGIIGAAVYAITDRIETAKFLNPLLFLIVIIYAYILLRAVAGLSSLWAALFSVTLGFNTVVVAQLLTFYNDGILFCAFVLIVLAGGHLLTVSQLWSRQARQPALILVSAVVLASNIKFTGLVFSFAILGALGLAVLFLRWRQWTEVFLFAGLFGGAIGAGFLLLGPSPYIQNVFAAGHIFHPLMGDAAFDIMTRSTPLAFREISSIEALWRSIFGKPELGVASYEWQWPFSPPSWSEIRAFTWVDPRVGGWGPFFPEQLTLAAAGAVWLFVSYRHLLVAKSGLLTFAMIIVLALIHPEAWWARYSAFLLFGPWAIFLALWLTTQNWPKMLAGAGMVLMLLNGILPAIAGWPTLYQISGKISAQLDELEAVQQPVRMSLGIFHPNRIKVRERDMEIITVPRRNDLECPNPKPFYNGTTISAYCP